MNVLRGEILLRQKVAGNGWWDDINSIVEHVTDQYHGSSTEFYDEVDDYRPSIYQVHAVVSSLRPSQREEYLDEVVTDMETAIHPVTFPHWAIEEPPQAVGDSEISDAASQARSLDGEDANDTAEDEAAPLATLEPTDLENGPGTITLLKPRLDMKPDLADTGASISATGLKSILHRFQHNLDY